MGFKEVVKSWRFGHLLINKDLLVKPDNIFVLCVDVLSFLFLILNYTVNVFIYNAKKGNSGIYIYD